MYENLMEEVVTEENRVRALEAVKRNRGAAGIDRMKTTELESHLQAHWEWIQTKLLAGTYVPSPVRRVEIPKPNGGTRRLVRDTYGTGPTDSADAVASADTDLRSDVQQA
jgi:hypothetical protein